MIDNKLIAQFTQARRDEELVFIEGFHALKHAYRFNADVVAAVSDDLDLVTPLVSNHAPEQSEVFKQIQLVSTETFQQLCPRIPRTRVLALAKRPPKQPLPTVGRIVVLDNPKDLGNVGTIIRTCAAADIAAVAIVGDIDPWHPTVVLSAAGLQFALNVQNIEFDELPNMPIVGLDERGEPLDQLIQESDQIFIFGSEREGLSDEARARTTALYRIPMRKNVSSLNLATSVAITVYSGQQGE